MGDDSDAGRLVPVNQPAQQIDYLESSHWKNEEDIAESWKFMTRQKHDLVNGLRLENASWRNWAKQRHRLKSVHPRALNWLKDSDTTWLYGPLYKADIDNFDVSRFGAASGPVTGPSAKSGSQSGDDAAAAPKSALKRRMPSELFKADTLFHGRSDKKLDGHIKSNESAVFKEHRHPKLRFNVTVEQCISIDHSEIISEEDFDDMYEDEDEVMGVDRGYESKVGRLRTRHDKYETLGGGAILWISPKRRRRLPRTIVRIHSTKLKPANWYGLEHEYDEEEDLELELQDVDMDDQEVPEIEDIDMELEAELELQEAAAATEHGYDEGIEGDVEDEETLFEGSVYQYPEPSEADYPTSIQLEDYPELVAETSSDREVEQAVQAEEEVSYVRPWNLPRSSSTSPTASSPLDQVDEEIKHYHELIGRVQERCSMLSPTPALRSHTPSPTPTPAPTPVNGVSAVAASAPVAETIVTPVIVSAPEQVAIVSQALRAPRSRVMRPLRDPITVDVRTPVRSSQQGWASFGADMKQVVKVGYHQSAVELVSNVMDIVSWASSIVYYSHTF